MFSFSVHVLHHTVLSPLTHQAKKTKRFKVQRRDILHSNACRYLVVDFSGEGCFGTVAKCVNLVTAQDVALKILKSQDSAEAEREINMLEVVSVLDPIGKSIVHFFEKFEYKGHTCLAFEMLDRSLYQLIRERQRKPLSVSEIRPIAQQLLTAFDALKGLGVIHSDLKPDNIMLVNHQDEPFRVKLIDFGLSHTISEVELGMKVQPVGYRAPEVSLGLPFSEAIDMWSLGCVLTYLYVAQQPFAVNCEYQMMKNIVEILGQPADHLLFAGKYSQKFFRLFRHFDYAKWWLKTPREYKKATGIEPQVWKPSFKSLDDLTTLFPETQEAIELEDQRAFVDLLKYLLDTDPERRITPGEALKHQYVSMAHLADEMDTSPYVDSSFDKMLVCPIGDLEEELNDSLAEAEGILVTLCSNGESSAASCSQDTHSSTGGSVEAGPAADGSSEQDATTTGSTKEKQAASSTASAPEGPAVDGSNEQDATTTGSTKEKQAASSTASAPEGPAVDGSSEQDATTTGSTKEKQAASSTASAPEGPAVDGSSEQDATTTGSTKEKQAASSTASAPEGPAVEEAKDQDESSSGPTKEESAATMTISAPEGLSAADGANDKDTVLTGLAEETAADCGSPEPVKIRRSPLKRMRKYFDRVFRTFFRKNR
ncbi:homeodomain-interacting protein kinase 4-like [Scomber scombrus]|uniref:Homeodomain-interacting protein kinase 4-like n=1 Tax=Scomber scombrus TaxID=13677 RepID=A0AAV1NR68_SCOSC